MSTSIDAFVKLEYEDMPDNFDMIFTNWYAAKDAQGRDGVYLQGDMVTKDGTVAVPTQKFLPEHLKQLLIPALDEVGIKDHDIDALIGTTQHVAKKSIVLPEEYETKPRWVPVKGNGNGESKGKGKGRRNA